MDRTRPFHMVENVLTGKVGGAMSTAGLNNCGGEGTLAALDSWFATQGMLSVHPRTAGAPLSGGVVATGFAGLDETGQPRWRSVKADEIGFALARPAGARGRVPGRAAGIAFLHSARADKTVVKLTE